MSLLLSILYADLILPIEWKKVGVGIDICPKPYKNVFIHRYTGPFLYNSNNEDHVIECNHYVVKSRTSEKLHSLAKNEIHCMTRLKEIDPIAFVNIYGWGIDSNSMDVYMESCRGDAMQFKKHLNAFAREFTRELIGNVHIMHTYNIVHRDIKPANIFLCPVDRNDENSNCNIKLADFEDCSSLPEDNDRCGTASYVPPEVLQYYNSFSLNFDVFELPESRRNVPYKTKPVDMFAVGSTLGELFNIMGIETRENRNRNHLKKSEFKNRFGCYLPSEDTWIDTTEYSIPNIVQLSLLIQELTHCDPSMRLTAKEALEHPYLK